LPPACSLGARLTATLSRADLLDRGVELRPLGGHRRPVRRAYVVEVDVYREPRDVEHEESNAVPPFNATRGPMNGCATIMLRVPAHLAPS
jgi:hypothetical protein